jgi:hypothetical protein
MTACKSWEDVAKLQQEWTASTVQACIDDASRFTQLASRFATSAAPVSEPIRQAPVQQAPVQPIHQAPVHKAPVSNEHRRSA